MKNIQYKDEFNITQTNQKLEMLKSLPKTLIENILKVDNKTLSRFKDFQSSYIEKSIKKGTISILIFSSCKHN